MAQPPNSRAVEMLALLLYVPVHVKLVIGPLQLECARPLEPPPISTLPL